jgi:membrane associated rhomboid family serine protease/cytochrome c-type biogenesis protein CcmH/NrfG
MANCIRCGRQLPGFTFGKKICQWCVRHEAYQRGELADDAPQPIMAAPWVRRESSVGLTQIILGINVAVFLGMVIDMLIHPYVPPSTIMGFSIPESIHWGANAGALTFSGEWWRLLTNIFVHGGIIHIAFNMWALWNLGELCESLYGRWTYATLYLICGVGASLASAAWNPFRASVGASGAIFGLVGALIAAFKLGEFSVPRSALTGTLRSLGAFVVYSLMFGLLPGIDNTAHIGGLITGLIVGALIALIAPQQDQAPRRVAIFLIVALALAGVAIGAGHYRGFPLRLGRASSFTEDNQPGRAVAQMETIVKQRPNFVPGHFELAQAYFNQGEYARSESELKRVLELQPKQADAQALLGMVYLNLNHPQDAQATFAQLLAQDSNNAEGHYGMGLALAAEGNHPAAIEEYKTAARLDPQAGGINYDLGISYAKLNQYDDAIAAFHKGQQLSGDDYDLESALAAAYQAKGMKQEAQDAKGKAEQFKSAGH